MEGLIFGGHYMAALRTGRVPSMVQAFDNSAIESGKTGLAPKIAEIKISVSRDRNAAREFVRESAGTRVLNMYRQGYSQKDIQNLGVKLKDVEKLDEADKTGVSPEGFEALVTDDMVDAIFIAGEPEDSLERMAEIHNIAQSQGFHQVMFSELGPDVDEALGLLVAEIIPAM